MARQKSPPPAPNAVPAWFMTYSDVVTLLMTFFILLLTFSTDEPEKFQQMQVAMFGGGGAKGLAGENDEALDRDTLAVRYRPPSARLTIRGSETPLTSGPVRESLDRGLASLDKSEEMAEVEQLQVDASLPMMHDERRNPSAYAYQQLRMLAIQMRSLPLTVELQVSDPEQLDVAVKLALLLQDEFQVPIGRVAVSQATPAELPPTVLRMVIARSRQSD